MRLKKPKKEKAILVNFKIEKNLLRMLTAKAKKYANGNISRWLRFAGINHVPKRKELE